MCNKQNRFYINIYKKKKILTPSHIKWHNWHCHTYQCTILILNNFTNPLEKFIKIWYFENIHWDESNDILYDIIYLCILVEKYGQKCIFSNMSSIIRQRE